MPVSFDWEFEEETGSSRKPGRGIGLSNGRRHWLLRGAILLGLLVLMGMALGMWVRARLDAVKKAEAELRSVVELELKSIADGDAEIFRGLQDPEDLLWETGQIARYISKVSSFAPAPGLESSGQAPEVDQVYVMGRLGRAELTFWFDAPTVDPSSSFPFQTAWFYRQDDDGAWYHVAPPDRYPGVPHSWHSAHLVVRATEVEAEFIDPIARDLAILVLEGCERLGCSGRARYTLSFDGELAAHVQEDRWTLPALYLTGMPEDEEAHAAWQRAIKPWVVEAFVRSQVRDRDLSNRVIYRQLVTRLQDALGLSADSDIVPLSPDLEWLAEVLREGELHTFQSLSSARYEPDDPEEMRLLANEVALLLQWIEAKVGSERLFELLPKLGEYVRLDAALLATYSLAPLDFEAEWFSYLFEQAGITPVPVSSAQRSALALAPLTMLPPPSLPPGDQIAFICDSRIWVGNADGSQMLPLAHRGESFEGLHWSPDGRWLLTTWFPDPGTGQSALHLLAADRTSGWLLRDDPALDVRPIGWSPDGREIVYHVWPVADSSGRGPGAWATGVGTGRTRSLPGRPIWSPDGTHVAFVTNTTDGPMGAVWLADSDWQSVRQIVAQAWTGSGDIWAPDSSRLALSVHRFDLDSAAIVIYDIETKSLTQLITADELAAAVSSLTPDLLTDVADPVIWPDRPLRDLWSVGWSADGRHLRVWAQATTDGSGIADATVLAVVPLDGSPPRVLARGSGAFIADTPWSPTDPNQMTFVWPTDGRQDGSASTYLFDLDVGPVYTATQIWDTAWSRDGAWVAFAGEDGVTIVDQRGRVRSTLADGSFCPEVAWNPSADLSALSRPVTITLVSAMDEWEFHNVRVYHDPFARTAHVWGEVVNKTGDDQRIVAFVPVLRDRNHNVVNAEQWNFMQGRRELVSVVDLADDGSLPFGLTVQLPHRTQLREDAEIVIFVAAESGEPTRDDMDIPFNDYDLSLRPEAFRVTGTFENPGPDLNEYVTVVVTVFGVDGQLMGWGWRHDTDPAYLARGTHPFDIRVTFAQTIADMDLEVGYYKIQVFGQ